MTVDDDFYKDTSVGHEKGDDGDRHTDSAYDEYMRKKRPPVNWHLVTLIGGPAHGVTVKLARGRRWHAHTHYTDAPGNIPGAKVVEVHQYAVDEDGIWRHIDNTHNLYIL
jgi:hypothetical protein